MSHDGWGAMLPFLIDTYKNGEATFNTEQLFVWHRINPTGSGCDFGGTSGNTASQLQIEFEPQTIVEDAVFVSALLSYDASIVVQIGSTLYGPDWAVIPFNHQGMFFVSVPFSGSTGDVRVCLTRNGADVLCVDSDPSKQNGEPLPC